MHSYTCHINFTIEQNVFYSIENTILKYVKKTYFEIL